jgi:hypothetical protein
MIKHFLTALKQGKVDMQEPQTGQYYYLKHPETNIDCRGKPQGGPNQRLCQHQSPITSIAMVQGEVLQKLTLKSTH